MKTVLLMFDSLNRRALSCYGGDVHTPNFQRLSDRALTFDNHYVGSLPCMPARRDLQTGRLNFMHRSWGPMEPFDRSAPEILQQHGTYSHLVTDHYHYFEEGGMNYQNRYSSWRLVRGQEWDRWNALVDAPFDQFKQQFHPLQFEREGNRARGMINRLFTEKEEDFTIARTFNLGFEFLQSNARADNWFLQLECFDPHEPFWVPASYRQRYPTEYQGPILDWPRYQKVAESTEEIAEIRANYAALVSMCDAYLGKLLDYFDRHNLWQEVALVVTTDHGFMLGEHDWWAKSRMPFYNEISHIPLLIYHPDYRQHSGQRRQALTQNIDLMPTFLDWNNAPIPSTVTGKSLSNTMHNDASVRDAAVYGQFGAATNVTDGRYTYFIYPDNIAEQELYEYTLLPTHQQLPFAAEEFAGASLVDGFDFTCGYPVMKIPSRPHPRRGQGGRLVDTHSRLFDLHNDPEQNHPLADDDTPVTRRLRQHVVDILSEHEAPPEAYKRLNL